MSTHRTFPALGLHKRVLAGVKTAGYKTPTEIQSKSIPLVLDGHDLVSCGETGSGKTAAFGLPMLDLLIDHGPSLRGLILVPTRELCVQVAENLRLYGKHTELHVRTAFGGIDIGIQEAAFRRGIDILVACPGRLFDHLERRNLTLENIEMVVLDEADRMMDLGFLPQIQRILVRCRQEHQTLLFSATMPPEVAELCKHFIPEARKVQVGRRSQSPISISHDFKEMPAHQKTPFLDSVLRRERGRVLVFVKTKAGAQRLGRELRDSGHLADSIHGDKTAEARYTALNQFERGKIRCMVATDVAARGIDVDDIELVVNFDLPQSVEDYVHRTGRTGRSGKRGRALSLVAPRERGMHQAIAKHLNARTDAEADRYSREGEREGGPRGGRRGGRRRDDAHGDPRAGPGRGRPRASARSGKGERASRGGARTGDASRSSAGGRSSGSSRRKRSGSSRGRGSR